MKNARIGGSHVIQLLSCRNCNGNFHFLLSECTWDSLNKPNQSIIILLVVYWFLFVSSRVFFSTNIIYIYGIKSMYKIQSSTSQYANRFNYSFCQSKCQSFDGFWLILWFTILTTSLCHLTFTMDEWYLLFIQFNFLLLWLLFDNNLT